jgi:hypothetical protein
MIFVKRSDITVGLNKRGNSARTRNARLAAINAFLRYLEYRLPSCLDHARRTHAGPDEEDRSATRCLIRFLCGSPLSRCGLANYSFKRHAVWSMALRP